MKFEYEGIIKKKKNSWFPIVSSLYCGTVFTYCFIHCGLDIVWNYPNWGLYLKGPQNSQHINPLTTISKDSRINDTEITLRKYKDIWASWHHLINGTWTICCCCTCCLGNKSCLTVCIFCPQNFPGKNTVEGCHFLLQVIFQTQGSNPHLPLGRQVLYQREDLWLIYCYLNWFTFFTPSPCISISRPTVEITNLIWPYAHLSLYLCIQRKFMAQNMSSSDDFGDPQGPPISSTGSFSYPTIRTLEPHHSHGNCWCNRENLHLVCPRWSHHDWIKFAIVSKHLCFTQNCAMYARNGRNYFSSGEL